MGFGGKRVGQMVVGFGGSGLGQAIAAVAAAFLLRLLTGPGPALLPETETEEDGSYDQAEDGDDDTSVAGEFIPVTIRWRNITCSLSENSSKSVIFPNFFLISFFPSLGFLFFFTCLVAEKMYDWVFIFSSV